MNAEVMQPTDSDLARFAALVELPADLTDPAPCWYWRGARHSKRRGYGKFWLWGRCTNAHKASYLMFNGAVPEGLVVHHTCVCESCVSPHHLVACTQSENILFSVECGNHPSQKRKREQCQESIQD